MDDQQEIFMFVTKQCSDVLYEKQHDKLLQSIHQKSTNSQV